MESTKVKRWLIVLLLVFLFCVPAHTSRLFTVDSTDRVVSTDSMNPAGDLSVCFWIRLPGSGDNSARAVSNRNDADGTVGYLFATATGGNNDNMRFLVAVGGTFRIAGPSAGTDLSDGEWHFVFGTYTAAATDAIVIWVDDMDSSADSKSGTFGTYDNATSNIAVGNDPDGSASTTSWPGEIADFAVWHRIVPAAERKVAQHGFISLLNPDLYYKLGVASPEPDWSAGTKDGTVTGATIGVSPPRPPHFGVSPGPVF